MSDPAYVIGSADRAGDGSLRPDDRERVGALLLDGGFVLLPSDTAYSVAVLPFSQVTREQLNIVLSRPDQPISLAFTTVAAAVRWAAPNPVATAILERFCPGPVTVVCRASYDVPAQVCDHVLATKNRTLGFRVPNSAVERSVAATTSYPITTTAVIDPAGPRPRPIVSFDEALAFVQARVGGTTFPRWCAIEGSIDHDELSTVVRVTPDGRLELVRAGAIALGEIEACRGDILQEQP